MIIYLLILIKDFLVVCEVWSTMKFFFYVSILFITNVAICKKFNPQFPDGSEHLILPSILVYAIHVGPANRMYLPFTIESIRLNPKIQYVFINIIQNPSDKIFKRFYRQTKKLSNLFQILNCVLFLVWDPFSEFRQI